MEKAKQEKLQKIVQAEGEAAAAKMIGEAISVNPGYLKLRKIRAAQSISRTVSAFTSIIESKAKVCCQYYTSLKP